MKDESKTKEQLIKELAELRKEIAQLKESETERRQVEEALRESEAGYWDLYENAPNAYFSVGVDGFIRRCNRRAGELIGCPAKELVGKPVFELYTDTPQGKEKASEVFQRFLTGERITGEELQMQKADGTPVWINLTVNAIRDAEGHVVESRSMIVDITECKRAEEEVRSKKRRFEDVAENALEWIWEIDADGKYTYSSPVVERILGYKAEEVLGKHFYDLFHSEDREELKRMAFESFAKKEPFREFINRNVDKNGKTVWLSTSGVPILDEKGDLLGYRGADTDITRARQVEEALRESEAQYRTLVESQVEGIAVIDPEERFTFANAAAHDIFGVARGDLVGRNLKEFTGADDFAAVRPETDPRRGGKRTTYEFEIARPNGERRSLVLTTTPRFDNDQRFIGAFGVFHDITERKKAEKVQSSIYRISEATHSTQDLEELFHSIHEIISELMPAKNIYIALHDASTETLSFPYFIDERDKTPVAKKIGKGLTEYVLRTGKPLLASPEVFEEIVRKGEVEILGTPAIDWLGVPLKTKDKTIGVLAVQSYTEGVRFEEKDKDILTFVSTQVAMAIERKRAEREIRKRQKYLESVLHNTPDAIVTLDATHRIIEWNPGAKQLFGYTRDEVFGKNIDEMITRPDVRDEAADLTRQVLAGDEVLPLETVRYRKDGTPVNVVVAGSPIRVGEDLQGVVAVYTDITERKKAEEALRRAKAELEEWSLQLEGKVRDRTRELEEAQKQLLRSERLATIGQLAASIGHEIRNPLGVLHNCLYMLDLKLRNPDEKVKKQLVTMKKELSRSDKIISDLLEFSRKREPSLVPTDLNRVIEESLSKVSATEEVEVVRELRDVPAVMADGEQLQSVFINLISNGIQAMPEGGTLTVKTNRNNRFVEVEISDTGVGMSKQNIRKIFEPLFTTKSKGIGLGLSVTKRFVENHGGTIRVKSRPNVGSTFVVRLPVEKEG